MQKGSATIGIKASLIEWERAGGTDRFTEGIRGDEFVQAYLEQLARVNEGLFRYGMAVDGAQPANGAIGSAALGLSECIGMGWRLQDLDGASYSASVCDGFSARIERIRERRAQKSVAPATSED